MSVTNAFQFVEDPNAATTVATGLAAALEILVAYINCVLSLVRRLGENVDFASVSSLRRLQTGSVRVDYTINIPSTATSSSGAPINATSIGNILTAAANDASVLASISTAIASAVTNQYQSQFVATVTGATPPTVTTVVVTTAIVTTTTAPTTTLAAGADAFARMRAGRVLDGSHILASLLAMFAVAVTHRLY